MKRMRSTAKGREDLKIGRWLCRTVCIHGLDGYGTEEGGVFSVLGYLPHIISTGQDYSRSQL